MKSWKLPRKWINEQFNEGKPVQIAATYTNCCVWYYLTTSGKVCNETHGWVEDVEDVEDNVTFSLPCNFTRSSIRRLQKALSNLQ